MATNDSNPRTIEIQMTKGYVAIVDEQDADLAMYKWHTSLSRKRPYGATSYKPVIYIHKTIYERVIGRQLLSKEMVDHINNDSLDNRRANLRLATPIQNAQNRKLNANNKSGCKGVVWRERDNRFEAMITVNKQRIYLGGYQTKELAFEAYKSAAIKYFGEFARFE